MKLTSALELHHEGRNSVERHGADKYAVGEVGFELVDVEEVLDVVHVHGGSEILYLLGVFAI